MHDKFMILEIGYSEKLCNTLGHLVHKQLQDYFIQIY